MKNSIGKCALSLILLGSVLGCDAGPTADSSPWPGWRGKDGSGVTTETAPLPAAWSPTSDNLRWSTEVPGLGNSSPIVVHGRVVVTSWKGPGARSVIAVDLATGEISWDTAIPDLEDERIHFSMTTRAAPTPATDGDHIFVYFGSILAKLDLDGNIVWRKLIDPDYEKHSGYGAASSPLLTDDAVIIYQDREKGDSPEPGWIASFDKESGDLEWRDEWDDTCCSYSTPALRRTEEGVQIICAMSGRIASYDAETGERQWVFEHGKMGQNVPSPVLAGDLLVVAGGSGSSRAMYALELNGRSEPEVLWETAGGIPVCSSPVIYQDLLFTVTDGGIMSCYDAHSGKRHWRKRLPGAGDFMNSLVAGDGKIYAQNIYGAIVVVAASPEYEMISHNRVVSESSPRKLANASPALAGGQLVLRTVKALHAVEAAAAGADEG